jgi:hypothetical protein
MRVWLPLASLVMMATGVVTWWEEVVVGGWAGDTEEAWGGASRVSQLASLWQVFGSAWCS